jgi:hypothetical protein
MAAGDRQAGGGPCAEKAPQQPHWGFLAAPQQTVDIRFGRWMQVIAKLVADPALGKHLSNPSVSYGSTNLYMRGALEAETRPNLDKVG